MRNTKNIQNDNIKTQQANNLANKQGNKQTNLQTHKMGHKMVRHAPKIQQTDWTPFLK